MADTLGMAVLDGYLYQLSVDPALHLQGNIHAVFPSQIVDNTIGTAIITGRIESDKMVF